MADPWIQRWSYPVNEATLQGLPYAGGAQFLATPATCAFLFEGASKVPGGVALVFARIGPRHAIAALRLPVPPVAPPPPEQ